MSYSRDTSYVLALNSSTDSYNIVVNSQYISPVYNVYITNNTYKNNKTITSVNLHNVPFVNNDMSNAFHNCFNLTSVTGINENVTNMTLSFWNCSNLVNAPIIPNSVTSMDETFYKCYNLVNAPVIPNNVINMFGTFGCCSNLVNAPVIPNNVTNMAATFAACSNLVNAPVIPNSVTDMFGTFDECTNLVNAPVIPNSITDMAFTFYQCSNLVNAPVIPNSVTNMYNAFYNCTNLTGNMYIQSENITDATNCFNQTSLTKNVYIPFTYENSVNTLTYNSFINAGYNTNGTTNGVYLKDINNRIYTLTVNGIGTGAVGGVVVDGVSCYNRSGYSGDEGDFSGSFSTGSTVAINWGTEKPDGTPVLEVNGVPEESGNPLSYSFTLTQDTVVNIYLSNTSSGGGAISYVAPQVPGKTDKG